MVTINYRVEYRSSRVCNNPPFCNHFNKMRTWQIHGHPNYSNAICCFGWGQAWKLNDNSHHSAVCILSIEMDYPPVRPSVCVSGNGEKTWHSTKHMYRFQGPLHLDTNNSGSSTLHRSIEPKSVNKTAEQLSAKKCWSMSALFTKPIQHRVSPCFLWLILGDIRYY